MSKGNILIIVTVGLLERILPPRPLIPHKIVTVKQTNVRLNNSTQFAEYRSAIPNHNHKMIPIREFLKKFLPLLDFKKGRSAALAVVCDLRKQAC